MARRQSKQPTYTLTMLDGAPSTSLRDLFVAQFGTDPGSRASRMFMQGNLGWVIQVEHDGKDPGHLRRKLRGELDKALSNSTRRPAYQPGTRLVREWQGKVFDVTIAEDGYVWNGRTYRSLSQIATEITCVRWSGPRFFGLKRGSQ